MKESNQVNDIIENRKRMVEEITQHCSDAHNNGDMEADLDEVFYTMKHFGYTQWDPSGDASLTMGGVVKNLRKKGWK